jgi:thiamine-monophosphate kinase
MDVGHSSQADSVAGATLGNSEVALISALRSRMTCSPCQVNDAFETDAELLDLGGTELLAITIDTLSAGSELVLAPTAYAKGWLTATVSLSDLAAVGARPIAVLLSCSFPEGSWTEQDAVDYGLGASDAVAAHGAHIVGGDTNWAADESFTSCALGLLPRKRPLRRLGAAPGDAVYCTAPVGAGNATGFRNVVLGPSLAQSWLPTARCAAADVLRQFAHACIDTSDGLLSAAMMLAAVSGVGVEIDERAEIYQHQARDLADASDLPRWLLAAAEWGEYELLFTVGAGTAERRCARALTELGMAPIRVGTVTAERQVLLRTEGACLDGAELSRLLRSLPVDGDLLQSLRSLLTEQGWDSQ